MGFVINVGVEAGIELGTLHMVGTCFTTELPFQLGTCGKSLRCRAPSSELSRSTLLLEQKRNLQVKSWRILWEWESRTPDTKAIAGLGIL